MGRYFCHEHPDVLSLETRVVDARPGAVVLEQTPFYPGGGGQLADAARFAGMAARSPSPASSPPATAASGTSWPRRRSQRAPWWRWSSPRSAR